MNRRPGVRVRSAVVAVLCGVLSLAPGAARAGSLFVDDDATGDGDGTSAHPYATIGRAVAEAADPGRFNPKSTVVIHVAAGTYDEGPIALDRSKTHVVGRTPVTWVDGFPGQPVSDEQSVIPWRPSGTSFRITADDVRVEGFTFVGPGSTHASWGTLGPTIDIAGSNAEPERVGEADTIEGVTIAGCAFLAGRTAVRAAHASVTVEDSFLQGHFNGIFLHPGPLGAGTTAVVRGNRVIGSQNAGVAALGQSPIAGREGEIHVEVYGNDLSDNGRKQPTGNNFGSGLHASIVNDSPVGSPIPVANQSLPAHLSIDVHDNVFVGNRHYGIAFSTRAVGTAPSSPSILSAHVEDNVFCGNGNNDVYVGTRFFFKALCPAIPAQLRDVSGADWDVELGADVGWDYSIGNYTGVNTRGPNHVVVNGQERAPASFISPWLDDPTLNYCNPDLALPVFCSE